MQEKNKKNTKCNEIVKYLSKKIQYIVIDFFVDFC